ncbi:MAG: hypothetical protein JNK84_21510 [Phreatobacter sp.]|uniref:hypothetical protein n=1 Tax=Phreatobacter sp. TaxID=1966341 RepID=UPI001A572AAB|nr:hypothetical protein [Phreatobacter sp.]MBL8571660.1 hypothetical protein [Phreatobacter sp.]
MSKDFDAFFRSREARRFYEDGPPHWIENEGKRYAKPSSTAKDAEIQKAKLVERLSTSTDTRARELGRILAACSVLSRCRSGACPCDNRALQRWFVDEVSGLAGVAEGEWSAISIVPTFGTFPVVDAPRDALKTFADLIKQLITGAGIDRAIIGIDPNFNEHAEGKFERHGQLQAWLLVRSEVLTKDVRRRLRRLLNKSATHLKPLVIKPYDGRLNGAAYALKHKFFRRVTTPPKKNDDGATVERQNSRPSRKPRVQQEVALSLLLHEAGPQGRLILHGWKLFNPQSRTEIKTTNKGEQQM